ncbi:MAG TPA: acetyl-CoA carboxylase biotin carboxyl carrier protein [Vicinamibacterales bacterium]|nr:acetyl-CoA carboxylase biotin carboxyl carrier protein [Vicinamibacterales bacterium]HOG29821.1 acetyl-CoA carboxylase biotin carboxyl carrier protein [Vicinamibacterales bacterium]HPW20916.1 acetyl-CoA carboxylase biotin carboxyl carrier protein [Vicinamibacterales bacterium]
MDEIRGVLDLVKAYDLQELEIEADGLKIRVRTAGLVHPAHHAAPAAAGAGLAAEAGASAPRAVAVGRADRPADATDAADLAIVTSPIVGTFYRAPEPGAPPFVEAGTRVKRGQVLCIIEAMKLMNEIESDHDGELVAVYVENGSPVQYGERLFAIKLS